MRRRLTYGDKPSAKRAKAVSNYSKKGMVFYRQPSTFNRCVIATTVTDTLTLSASDYLAGYGFAPAKLWISGVSAFNYATNIINVWDLCRIVKVEITVAASANQASFIAGNGIQMPWAYDAFDPNDNNAPVSTTEIQQNSTCQMFRLDKVHKRTIYPTVQASSVADIGSGRKNRFINAIVDLAMNGYKIVIEAPTSPHNPTDTEVRINFKVFMEVRQTI